MLFAMTPSTAVFCHKSSRMLWIRMPRFAVACQIVLFSSLSDCAPERDTPSPNPPKGCESQAAQGWPSLVKARESQAAQGWPNLVKGAETQAAQGFLNLAKGREKMGAQGWPNLRKGTETMAAQGYPGLAKGRKTQVATRSAALTMALQHLDAQGWAREFDAKNGTVKRSSGLYNEREIGLMARTAIFDKKTTTLAQLSRILKLGTSKSNTDYEVLRSKLRPAYIWSAKKLGTSF